MPTISMDLSLNRFAKWLSKTISRHTFWANPPARKCSTRSIWSAHTKICQNNVFLICNFANKTNSTFCNRVASITDAIFYDEKYPRILNYQVGRKKKSNFKIKKKFGKRGSQTQNSVEVQNTKVYRQSTTLKIVLWNKSFCEK